jgi:hypothetical protein
MVRVSAAVITAVMRIASVIRAVTIGEGGPDDKQNHGDDNNGHGEFPHGDFLSIQGWFVTFEFSHLHLVYQSV